jgi:serine/threonine-protein kinase 24/25/MST4
MDDAIIINGYEFLEELGSGSFGTVFKCINTETNDIFATKIILKENVNNNKKLLT